MKAKKQQTGVNTGSIITPTRQNGLICASFATALSGRITSLWKTRSCIIRRKGTVRSTRVRTLWRRGGRRRRSRWRTWGSAAHVSARPAATPVITITILLQIPAIETSLSPVREQIANTVCFFVQNITTKMLQNYRNLKKSWRALISSWMWPCPSWLRSMTRWRLKLCCARYPLILPTNRCALFHPISPLTRRIWFKKPI